MAHYKRMSEWQTTLEKKFEKTDFVYLTVELAMYKNDKRKQPPRSERVRVKAVCANIADAENLINAGALLYGAPLRIHTSKRVFYNSECISLYSKKNYVLI